MKATSARRVHGIVIVGCCVAIVGCGNEPISVSIDPPTAASLDVIGGNGQSGVVGSELGTPLVVRVLDSKGKGVPNLAVQFMVISGGGKVFATSSETNVQGDARNYWTLGTVAGVQTVEARTIDAAAGAKVLHGLFSATALAGSADKATLVADGMPTSAPEGSALSSLPGIQVVDQYGNPKSGVTVSFAMVGGGSVTPASTQTNVQGIAKPSQWIVGPDRTTLNMSFSTNAGPGMLSASIVGIGAWTFVASGQSTTCALDTSARAYCWGRNVRGTLGNGLTSNSASPVPVSGNRAFSKLTVGWEHACGIEQGSNVVYCWGRNDTGNLGDGTSIDRSTPVAVTFPPSAGTAVDVVAGGGQTCAIATNRLTYCWGYGEYGILGNGTNSSSTSPVPIVNDPGFVSLAAGISHTCGLTTAGEAWCWGYGVLGELGTSADAATGFYTSDQPLAALTSQRFSRIELGGNYTCGVRSVGDVLCWGEGRFGQLGTTTTAMCDGASIQCRPVPASAAPWYAFRSLSLGRAREWSVNGYGSSVHTCGIDFQGRGFCWGSSDAGQLGNGVAGPLGSFQRLPQQVVVPTPTPGIKGFAAGYRHTCALTETNQIWCVGANEQGQLGSGVVNAQNTAFGRVAHP